MHLHAAEGNIDDIRQLRRVLTPRLADIHAERDDTIALAYQLLHDDSRARRGGPS